MEQDIRKSLEVLKTGGIILYPTDTIWGIGCDATCEEAVNRISHIKKKKDIKRLLVLLDDPGKLHHYVEMIPDIAWELIETTDRPLTIIYPSGKNLACNLLHADGSVGIRITSDKFCKKLITGLGKPLVSTSANISGESAPANFKAIHESIKSSVDYTVKWRQDDLTKGIPSAIIKLGIKDEIEIIRK
jgi:L-threonylcarbamoyladenylate synthase